jgi:pilus assembly protein CpaB
MLLEIASKPIDTGTTYTVGSDVSRFQRSTVPSKGAAKASADPMAQMGQVFGSLAGAISGRPASAPADPAAPVGPVVRIARGNNVTVVPVGAK